MPSSHLILCCPLLLLPPIPPSIRVFSNESTLRMRWPKYRSFSFSIIPSKEISGLISLQNGLVGSPCSPRDSQGSSPAPQFKRINSSALSLLHSPTLTSIHDSLINHGKCKFNWLSKVILPILLKHEIVHIKYKSKLVLYIKKKRKNRSSYLIILPLQNHCRW